MTRHMSQSTSSTKNALRLRLSMWPKMFAASVLLCSATYGSQQKNPSNTYQQKSSSNQQPTPAVSNSAAPTLNNQQAAGSHPEEPTWWNADRGTWALVFVGIAGTVAALLTLRAINQQVAEMRSTGNQTDALI